MLVGFAHVAGGDVVPPGDLVELIEPALAAGAGKGERAPEEEEQLADGDPALHDPHRAQRFDQPLEGKLEARRDLRRRLLRAREQLEVAPHQVIGDGAAVAADGDARHRRRQVLVEAGEEVEAVMARQLAAAVGARAGDGDAAHLAAPVLLLEHGDGKAALEELVGDREAADTAAEDEDPWTRAAQAHGARIIPEIDDAGI